MQKLDKVVTDRMPSQATKLLEVEPKKDNPEAPEASKAGQSINYTEENDGRRYSEMPEMDVRTVQDEKLEPGTMRKIVVQADLGHEGAVLISPIRDLDSRYICLRTISLMTERPLQAEEHRPITAKQRHKIEKGKRVATYAVYNMS